MSMGSVSSAITRKGRWLVQEVSHFEPGDLNPLPDPDPNHDPVPVSVPEPDPVPVPVPNPNSVPDAEPDLN